MGWWKWPLEIKGDVTVEVIKRDDGFAVTFDGAAPEEFWKNPDFSGVDEPVIALHVVLRPIVSEAVRFDDIVYVYNSAEALRRIAAAPQRSSTIPAAGVPSARRGIVWPRESTVHLVSTNVFERDAVGNFTLSLHRLLRANGVPCQLYASNFDPRLRETIRHTCELFTAAARGRPGAASIFRFSSPGCRSWSSCRARRSCTSTTSRRRGSCRSTTPNTPRIAPTASRS